MLNSPSGETSSAFRKRFAEFAPNGANKSNPFFGAALLFQKTLLGRRSVRPKGVHGAAANPLPESPAGDFRQTQEVSPEGETSF